MGQQIIEQPDGRYAVYDTVAGAFVFVDGTPEEITEWRAEEAAEAARERTAAEFRRVARSERPYHQFTLTWDEAAARNRATIRHTGSSQ